MQSGLVKLGLDALYYSGAKSLLSGFSRGAGVIFTLHQVRPANHAPFHPNGILEVTPEFLESAIIEVRRQGHDIVSLDEAHARLTGKTRDRPFVCFTFDDGYRDNRDFAFPILKKHGCPFTIYVTTSYSDGTGNLWWLALERLIAANTRIAVPMEAGDRAFDIATDGDKHAAYNEIYWWLRDLNQNRQREIIAELAERHDFDLAELCRSEVMNWRELVEFSEEPLLTIGAHTVHHYALAKLDEAAARREMADSIAIIGRKLGTKPDHFSYPYGDADSAGPREFRIARELGVRTAVTTRKGVLFSAHDDYLTALPRVSLNGDYQARRYVDLFLSGTPFLLWNRFRRMNVA